MQPFSSTTTATAAAFLTLVLLLPEQSNSYSLRHSKLFEFQTKLQEKATSMITPAPAAASSPSSSAGAPDHQTPPNAKKREGRVFYPIGYGADPTGEEDSSEAILEALRDALDSTSSKMNSMELLPGISDLGGVVIDLQGGSFKISHPIRFPPGVGNILVHGGTFRASNTFPGDRHLVELWSPNSAKSMKSDIIGDTIFSDMKDQNGGIYYEDVTFRDILFDSSFRGGGLLIIDSARVRVSSCFFIRFTTQGILVEKGHETFISTSFLGQHPTVGGDRGERDFSGTAIDLASNDNAITDVAIFSAATGIVLRGQANVVTGVHCYNKAAAFGGVGILVKASQTRLVDCYLDYNSIVMEDPDRVHVANGYFLGDGNIVLRSVRGRISGLNIINNIFSGDSSKMVPIVQLDGQFSDVDQVLIDSNSVSGMSLKSTVGRLTVAGNATQWVADFAPVLVFPNRISHVQYSFFSRGVAAAELGGSNFPAHAVRNVSDNVVVVESDRAVDGVVSFLVDQHNLAGERNLYM